MNKIKIVNHIQPTIDLMFKGKTLMLYNLVFTDLRYPFSLLPHVFYLLAMCAYLLHLDIQEPHGMIQPNINNCMMM